MPANHRDTIISEAKVCAKRLIVSPSLDVDEILA